jgi:hypothetical protein
VSERSEAPDSEGRDGDVGDRIRSLLYAGEQPRAAMQIADGYLVATTHRLLVYTPRGDGANLQVVQRPNASALTHDASGNTMLLKPIVYTVGGGLLLAILGTVLDFGSMAGAVPSIEGPGIGVGSILAQVSSLLAMVAIVDEVMAVVGALSLLVGMLLIGVYLYTRQSEIVVTVAGESDLRIAAGSATNSDTETFAEEAGIEYSPPLF